MEQLSQLVSEATKFTEVVGQGGSGRPGRFPGVLRNFEVERNVAEVIGRGLQDEFASQRPPCSSPVPVTSFAKVFKELTQSGTFSLLVDAINLRRVGVKSLVAV